MSLKTMWDRMYLDGKGNPGKIPVILLAPHYNELGYFKGFADEDPQKVGTYFSVIQGATYGVYQDQRSGAGVFACHANDALGSASAPSAVRVTKEGEPELGLILISNVSVEFVLAILGREPDCAVVVGDESIWKLYKLEIQNDFFPSARIPIYGFIPTSIKLADFVAKTIHHRDWATRERLQAHQGRTRTSLADDLNFDTHGRVPILD